MSEFLGSTRTVDQVRTLFYPPSSLSSSSSTTAQNTKRRPGFLTAIDDGRYQEMYKRILTTSQLRFTNIHRLVCLSKDDGKVLFQVMSHVVAWLNANPTTTSYRRDNNKPPLRADIAAKLDHCSDRDVRDAEKRLGIFVWEPDHHNSTSKAASILLQHEVLDFVLQRVADFKKPAVKLYLEQAPQQVDSAQYTKRFSHETWSGVLTIVQRWVGHDFSSEWMERPRDGHSVHDEQARSADARSSGSTHHLALTESLGDYIRCDPDLAADSASIMEKLGNEAFEAVLNRWLTQQQGQFRPDPAGSHYHEEASTSGPVTVTGPRITPDLYEEEQGVRAQEKAKNPGYDGRSTGVSGSGPDRSETDPDLNPDSVASQPRTPVEVEIVQIQELSPAKARPSMGKARHTGTPQRHSLPEKRPPGQHHRTGGSDRVTSRAGAPTSSRQSRTGGKNGIPTASALSSPSSSRPARVTGARSSSSRIVRNEPSWARGVEAK
ncbi:hypothetical protein V3481_004239 [Fusarium oxysporum f. sp. vasinfectum]